jgi:hypothetical protein
VSWVKIDDKFPHHPKVLMLSDRAFRAFIVGLCYAAEYLTDGFVPSGIVRIPAGRELEEAGLFRQEGAGWWIHDYLKWQRSKQEVEQLSSKRRASGQAKGRQHADKMPLSVSVSKSGSGVGLDLKGKESDFEAFFAAFPTARKGARRPVRKAWDKAIRRADPPAIILAAQRYRDDPNREDEYTAGAAAWLNRDGWEEPPLPTRNGRAREFEGQGARLMREAAALREQGL